MWQETGNRHELYLDEPTNLVAVASGNGAFEPLDNDEVGALCDRLSATEGEPKDG
jgi:hypothetical protein